MNYLSDFMNLFQPLQNDLRATPDEHLRAFFGPQARYYLDVAQDFRDGVPFRYNIAAFFLGLFWMLYRKLYAVFVITALLVVLEQQLEQRLLPNLAANPAWNTFSNLVTASLVGMLGNRLYLRQAVNKIAEVTALGLGEEATLAELRRRGGTSWAGPLALIAFVAAALYAGLAAG